MNYLSTTPRTAITFGSSQSSSREIKKCTHSLHLSIGWIDISNLLAKVPIINNTIFVKILTLPHD